MNVCLFALNYLGITSRKKWGCDIAFTPVDLFLKKEMSTHIEQTRDKMFKILY